MVYFPNAKINLGLHVLERLDSGYHKIESCFYPITWHDALEIVPSNDLNFQSYGLPIPGNSENNLCLKAYNLLKNDHLAEPAISLVKSVEDIDEIWKKYYTKHTDIRESW